MGEGVNKKTSAAADISGIHLRGETEMKPIKETLAGHEELERIMQTSLLAIAKKAANQKTYRFRNLIGMLTEEFLVDSWRFIRRDAAYGVDRVSAADYERNLEGNIHNLVEKLKEKRYHAKLIRRKWIPKGEDKFRPLGIPAVEDKLLQIAVTRILEAIYEQDFLRCSYGYRPNTGAQEAVRKLTIKLQFGRYEHVVDADIKGFFDNLNHDWMMKLLEKRIDDEPFLRLIKKWLKAGIMEEDGPVIHPTTGSPQGGIVSPVLSNIYLHSVLDIWFHRDVRARCKGEACLIRYADDFVACFEKEEEAERFHGELGERLKMFGLELSTEKTRLIPFDRNHPESSFDFLGFEFRWGQDRGGKPHVKRQTSRKKFRQSISRMTEWCQTNRNLNRRQFFQRLGAKLRGYSNYYGVIGNSRRLGDFFQQAIRIAQKWRNRGNQRRSYNWHGFTEAMKTFQIPGATIMERQRISRAMYAV
jgi:group II intron reverse transcriptase/maturase